MVGPSKILTVSYGTFSCTLEGFDDPFSTMRGIAEYFRDLAADDRYFGAEPPTPDAEMLHRIAEREVQHRVEAHVDDNGITLRQMDDEADEPEIATQEPVTEVAAPILAAVTATASLDEVEHIEPEVEEVPVAAESVAAKLARIRSVVADDNYEEDEHAEEIFTKSPISSAFRDIEEAGAENEVEVEQFDEVAKYVTEAPAESEIKDEGSAEEVAVIKIAEFEAVDVDVEVATEEPSAFEEKASEEIVDEGEEFEVEAAEAVDEVDELTEAEDDEEPAEMADVAESEEADEVVEALAEEDALEEDEIEEVAEVVTDASEFEIVEVADEEELFADAEAEEETAAGDFDEIEEDEIEDNTVSSVTSFMDSFAANQRDADNAEGEATSEPDGSAIARVIKMRRADFEAAVAHGEIEELDNSDVVDAEIAGVEEITLDEAEKVVETTLSPEDEAELMATLEQVQREADAERRSEKEGRAYLEKDDIETNTNSVSRILEVTNTEMEETEGTRRRSAIAHLKAAVAATRADKFLSKKREKEDADELNQYRDDLARVVRPKRPSDAERTTERRMAPLMLVSEQRVDQAEPKTDDAASVMPRRVISGNYTLEEEDAASVNNGEEDENIFRDVNSFSEFAEEMGASELPDLLEAAAAYASFVEGRPHFSRPQIMKAVAAVRDDEEYTREEGLRSFGMLLRRGKIQKVKRGQFKVADTTRFNPDARIAGE